MGSIDELTVLPRWERPAKTKFDLPWANLTAIDLSKFDQPSGKVTLAEELKHAVHQDGFFAVTGTGFTDEEVVRQFEIGQAYFKQPLDKKNKSELRCDFGVGNYFGYRAAYEKTIMGTDVLDNIESINISKFTTHYENDPTRPPFLHQFEPEIASFSRRSYEIAKKIFVLFAIILELPEDYFTSRHRYEDPSEDHLRYMTYHPRPLADDAKVQNTWSRSHTDFGSLTLLWSQNVAGLQIKAIEGDWRYVRPLDAGIICNVGDTLSFWSAGYLKSTVHRVVRPPPDQADGNRLGLFYFVRPGDRAQIGKAPSPLLKRLGLVTQQEIDGGRTVTGIEYVRGRVKDYHDHMDYGDRKGKIFKVGNLETEDEVA